jgi:hypothetical protein
MLVIEWAAKPQLEARNERVLERHRAREIATVADFRLYHEITRS